MDCRSHNASLAVEEENRDDFYTATSILTNEIRHDPENHELYLERSICNYELGKYQASLEDIDTAIRLNPDDPTLHYQRGLALNGLANYDGSKRSFMKAIELTAKREDVRFSEVFKLLTDASKATHAAKERNRRIFQATLPTTNTTTVYNGTTTEHAAGASDEPVTSSRRPTDQAASISSEPVTSSKRSHETVVVPSSSMPAVPDLATSSSSAPAKYKRLRRDRERARRGTSKLCTIKIEDLNELKNSNSTMRVIAPIDGWLYAGKLSLDGCVPQYVVKLDGDSTGSSYLFNQETVLNDVIKEVRVKSVSELRKGARICCYWSREYKCLSTGVVTSRTFEPQKSLVSVKYDNGDLSALPLEDLRLLPPDYPKYMSNCDPLLLKRDNDGGASPSPNLDSTRNWPEETMHNTRSNTCPKTKSDDNKSAEILDTIEVVDKNYADNSSSTSEPQLEIDTQVSESNLPTPTRTVSPTMEADIKLAEGNTDLVVDQLSDDLTERDDGDDDATIPPTSEAIEFITSDGDLDQQDVTRVDRSTISNKESMASNEKNVSLITDCQLITNGGCRDPSEDNNFGVEYRPWHFEGPPKRSKRHGRTYRDNYVAIRRGNESLRIGDSAELMPRDESILPFIAKIDGFWATSRGEMRVRVRWYYRLTETEGEPYELRDGENALFETDHFDENDVQSIYRPAKILSWTDYSQAHLGHINKQIDGPKIFYLAGYYDPVRRVKHFRTDVKEGQ